MSPFSDFHLNVEKEERENLSRIKNEPLSVRMCWVVGLERGESEREREVLLRKVAIVCIVYERPKRTKREIE